MRKLSNLTAKLTGMKGIAVRVLAAGTLAGAFLMAATPKAEAQRVVIGFGAGIYAPAPPVGYYGGPVYGQPGYYQPGYGQPYYGPSPYDQPYYGGQAYYNGYGQRDDDDDRGRWGDDRHGWGRGWNGDYRRGWGRRQGDDDDQGDDD